MTRHGYTLIDVILVVLIVFFLLLLLIPAIQAVRESSRMTYCKENLRKLCDAVKQHESVKHFFPTGGWGNQWLGDPDRGFGTDQPGGWCFNILPYLGYQELHDTSHGRKSNEKTGPTIRLLQTPIPEFICVSRRTVKIYPFYYKTQGSKFVSAVAKTDYAINRGDLYIVPGTGPASIEDKKYKWPDMSKMTGISYIRSTVARKHITDGLDKTYLVGEKHLPPRDYETGGNPGDDSSLYYGDDPDIARQTGINPGQIAYPFYDPDPGNMFSFGSAHPSGWNMTFCDGSLRTLTYDIDGELHRKLGNRMDGEPKNLDQLPQAE